MDVQHSGITQKIGGSLGAVPWLLPSETASEILSWEGFWEETISWIWLDISLLRNSLYLYGMFLRSFLRRKHILDIVSQKQISCDLSTSSAVAKLRGPFGKFQLEAPRAYKCKQILGLCHSPPRMENQGGLWKKNLCEAKMYPANTWVLWLIVM